MPSVFSVKALGLNTMPNQLDVDDGSLSIAKNVIINRDNVVEPRRGFKIYGNSFGSTSDRANQLFSYKERILRHFQSTLQFDDGNGNFQSFAGNFLETEEGLRIKSIESNGNLYFTTSEGIKKISARTAADFSTVDGFITAAGAVKAVDATAEVKYNYGDKSSFLVQDSAVAYRIAWGYRDLNNNLFIGTPSQRIEVYNSMLTLMLQDYMILLGAIDNIGESGSIIDDQDYVETLGLPITASAASLRDNLIALAVKLDEDIVYSSPTGPLVIGSAAITGTICTITFSSGDPTQYLESGSLIFLTGFSPASGTLDGVQTIASVTSTEITFNTTASGLVTVDPAATIVSNEYRGIPQPPVPSTPAVHGDLQDIQDYLSFIITRLNLEPDTVIPALVATEYIEPLDITTASTVLLNITIPDDINSSYFFQIYRSSVFVADDTSVLSTDVFPNDELQLVYEAFPTAAEVLAGQIIVEDIVPDAFRGANLYTNASTGEGILQANDIPPFAKDINVFKNSVFYANTRTRHRKELALLGVQSMIEAYNAGDIPQITISNSEIFHTYDFIIGESESFDITTDAAATLASSGNGSYFLINGGNNQELYYVWYKLGTSVDPMISDRTGISVLLDIADTDDQVAEKTRNALNIVSRDFLASSATNVVSVLCTKVGYTDDPIDGDTGFIFASTGQGQGEKVSQQQSLIETVADTAGSLAGTYFTINSTFNQQQFYIWFQVNGVGINPNIVGYTGIEVDLLTNDSADVVAENIELALADYSDIFTVSRSTNELTITNNQFGPTNGAAAGTSGFTVTDLQEGALQVLLSNDISPARAVTITAGSLSSVINRNKSEIVYNFYTSGAQEVPGKMIFEARDLNTPQFFLNSNDEATGNSFSPTIAPMIQISSISTGSPTSMVVTTAAPHGFSNLEYIIISGSNSIPSIDGYHQITYLSPTTFRIAIFVTTAGTEGGVSEISDLEASSNEESKNRVYYSKTQQPESVPILNYFDVGARDKAILRIYPLRDSLFVFKEDGLYRISGEAIPFNLGLFDSSCITVAADSVSSMDNVIYSWTRQGVSSITESGVRNVSRPIDVDLLPLSSNNYPSFKTATWGLGYESDKSYTVFTVSKQSDEYATIGYKYNGLTNSWTTVAKDYVCGVIHSTDDRMYVGVGDTNNIEQERKTFTREDYADREFEFEIQDGRYFNRVISLDSVNNIDVSDVFMQYQTITVYDFNVLLKKLDLDPGVPSSDYFSTLSIGPGDDTREALIALAEKLDNDNLGFTDYEASIADKSGTITAISAGSPVIITSNNHGLITGRKVLLASTNSVPSINNEYIVTVLDTNRFSVLASTITPGTTGTFGTLNNDFADLYVCFNEIIRKLSADTVVAFNNYLPLNKITKQEILITAVDRVAKRITVAAELDFVVGPFTVFKSIDCEFQYSPNTFGGDPVTLKHMREAQFLFESLAFTNIKASFATDLLPKFESITFNADGNGRFGFSDFGSGFFGGASNSAPLRTYIPRNCQRCRYMVLKINHRVAREKWSLFGITLTGETELSTRAYK